MCRGARRGGGEAGQQDRDWGGPGSQGARRQEASLAVLAPYLHGPEAGASECGALGSLGASP